jgi:hypothetical protein
MWESEDAPSRPQCDSMRWWLASVASKTATTTRTPAPPRKQRPARSTPPDHDHFWPVGAQHELATFVAKNLSGREASELTRILTKHHGFGRVLIDPMPTPYREFNVAVAPRLSQADAARYLAELTRRKLAGESFIRQLDRKRSGWFRR